MEEIRDKVIQIVSKALHIKADKITMDSNIQKDLGADSLDVMELLMAFEDEYGIEVSDEDAVQFVTIGDVVNYINSKK